MAERNTVRRYSRAELLRMKALKPSGVRPKHLANKFNNEDGLFSPDKWIDNIWRVEGVIDRCDSNKKNSKHEQSLASAERSNAYSPQKRTYSSGSCGKVELPEEADKPRSRIRNRSSKSSGVDFRPAFQKNASTPPLWQRPRSPMNKRDWSARESHPRSSTNKTYERGGAREEEEAPEWLDAGPLSMDELMDLGGFGDEDALDGEQAAKCGGGGTPPLQKLNKDGEVAKTFSPNSKEPPSDDFVDCFKLINLAMDDELALKADNAAPLGGSRLSRFFSSEQPPEKVPESGGGTTGHQYAEVLPYNGGHSPAATDQSMGQTSPIYPAPPTITNEIITNATPGQPPLSLGHHQLQQQAPGYAQSLQNQLPQLPPQRSSPFNLGNEFTQHNAITSQALMGTAPGSSDQQAQIAQALSSIQFQIQQYGHLPVFQAFMRRYNTAYVTMLQQGASMNGVSIEQARINFIQGALQQWQRYLEQVKLQQQQQQPVQLMQQSQPHTQLSACNGHVYNGNASLAYTSQQQHVTPNGLGMASDPPYFYSQQPQQLVSSTAPTASSMPHAFSYQLNIPTSDFGSLQNQLKQAINRGDIEAQKSIRTQMLEALNGGQ